MPEYEIEQRSISLLRLQLCSAFLLNFRNFKFIPYMQIMRNNSRRRFYYTLLLAGKTEHINITGSLKQNDYL